MSIHAVELFTHESVTESESESERDPNEAFRDATVDPKAPQQSAETKKLHWNFPCTQKILAHELIG